MREATQNEYHKSVNRAVDFINEHLCDAIDLETLAGVANISGFHFHRIFKAFIGESIGAYITRLRLECTAQYLQTSNLALAEIAEKTGYQSQFALSKAFKKNFGLSPSAFRNLHSYFTTQFCRPETEPLELSPEIREVGQKELVYIRIIAQYGSPEHYETAWEKLLQFAQNKQLLSGENEFIGLSFDDPAITQHERCRYYGCITTKMKIRPEGEFGTLSLEGGRYAVFTLKGPYSGLNRLYNAIYYQWLPRSDLKLRDIMSFEKYLNGAHEVSESDLLTEVFLPIL